MTRGNQFTREQKKVPGAGEGRVDVSDAVSTGRGHRAELLISHFAVHCGPLGIPYQELGRWCLFFGDLKASSSLPTPEACWLMLRTLMAANLKRSLWCRCLGCCCCRAEMEGARDDNPGRSSTPVSSSGKLHALGPGLGVLSHQFKTSVGRRGKLPSPGLSERSVPKERMTLGRWRSLETGKKAIVDGWFW